MDKKTLARLAQHSRPRHPQYAVTHNQPGQQNGPVKIDHAHDGVLQYIVFNQPVTHCGFNEAHLDQFIAALLNCKALLAKHKAEGGPVTTQGNDSAN